MPLSAAYCNGLLAAIVIVLVVILIFLMLKHKREHMAGSRWSTRDILNAQVEENQGRPADTPFPSSSPWVKSQQIALGEIPPPPIKQVQRALLAARAGQAPEGVSKAAVRVAKALRKENIDPKPENLEEAERGMWQVIDDASAHSFNPELGADTASDISQYYAPEPAIDYNTALADAAVDSRARESHKQWVEEMKPFYQGAMNVDTFEPAYSLNWQGLRLPQPVAQGNQLFLTEITTEDLLPNKKFNFVDNTPQAPER